LVLSRGDPKIMLLLGLRHAGPGERTKLGPETHAPLEIDSDLQRSLQHFQLARRFCPLFARPHIRIATCAWFLNDERAMHRAMDTASLLFENDPEYWFLVGLQENRDNHPALVWQAWRR